MNVYSMYESMRRFIQLDPDCQLYCQDGYFYVQIVVYDKAVRSDLIDLGWEQVQSILEGLYIWRVKL